MSVYSRNWAVSAIIVTGSTSTCKKLESSTGLAVLVEDSYIGHYISVIMNLDGHGSPIHLPRTPSSRCDCAICQCMLEPEGRV